MYSLLVNDKNVSFMSTNLRRLERDLHYSATNQHNSHLSFLLYSPPTVPYVLLSHLSNESGIGLLSSCITQLLNPVASKHSTVDKRQCMQKFSGVLWYWYSAAAHCHTVKSFCILWHTWPPCWNIVYSLSMDSVVSLLVCCMSCCCCFLSLHLDCKCCTRLL